MLNTNPATIDNIINQRMAAVAQTLEVQQGKVNDRAYRLVRACMIIVYICFFFIVGITLLQMWGDWQSHDWHDYSSQISGIFPMLSGLLVFHHTIPVLRTPFRTAIRALRRAAARSDDQLAPLAAIQPKPLLGNEYTVGAEYIGPLHGQRDVLRGGILQFVALFLLMPMLITGAAGVITLIGVQQNLGAQLAGWQIGLFLGIALILFGVTAIMAYFAVRLFIRGRQIRRGITVVADEMGLRWKDTRWGTGKHTLAWSDVQSFVTCRYQRLGEPSTVVYALQGDTETFFWATNKFTSPNEIDSSERLCRLAITRTQKPLRDLSYAVRGLAVSSYFAMFSQQRAAAVRLKLDPRDVSASRMVEGIYTPPTFRSMTRGLTFSLTLVIATFIVFVPGAWLLQHLH